MVLPCAHFPDRQYRSGTVSWRSMRRPARSSSTGRVCRSPQSVFGIVAENFSHRNEGRSALNRARSSSRSRACFAARSLAASGLSTE